jgi:hypothetical protein
LPLPLPLFLFLFLFLFFWFVIPAGNPLRLLLLLLDKPRLQPWHITLNNDAGLAPAGQGVAKIIRMLPLIQGVIARRILLNFRADPDVVQRLLPAPLQVDRQHGHAIVGICLIRLENLRPNGVPGAFGLSSENMAHRVAIQYPTGEGIRPGVFVWRRETDQRLVELLGGRLFPGVHGHAGFQVSESDDCLGMDVTSDDGKADVHFSARVSKEWRPTPSFSSFDEVSEFFRKGDCGFSCSLSGNELEGLQLKTLKWEMAPLEIESQHSAFYSDSLRFPTGSLDFDCGLLMRGIPHEWHQLADIPELTVNA